MFEDCGEGKDGRERHQSQPELHHRQRPADPDEQEESAHGALGGVTIQSVEDRRVDAQRQRRRQAQKRDCRQPHCLGPQLRRHFGRRQQHDGKDRRAEQNYSHTCETEDEQAGRHDTIEQRRVAGSPAPGHVTH